MGTNYYLRKNICPCCSRYDEIHIGKSSAGWSFSFHGFRKENDEGLIIISYKDWLKELQNGEIYDEYGRKVTLEEFMKLVENKKDASLNHTAYCRNSDCEFNRKHAEEYCWLDESGNSFQAGEWS